MGIPIGNLTSQLFANIYLNELDNFIKHRLRIKYYIRYMDDFLILDFNKKILHQIKGKIGEFLRNRLKLELHPKKANVFPMDKARPPRLSESLQARDGGRGIDFLGYQIFRTHRLLRKSTVKRFIKRMKIYQKRLRENLMSKEKFNNSLQSWLAYARHANSWRLRKNLSERLKLVLTK